MKESYENLSVVSSLEELQEIKINHKCIIDPKAPNLIYLPANNRGGFTNTRKVKVFMELITSNSFFGQLAKIVVDHQGVVYEGIHKVLAFIELGIPFVVDICYPKTISQVALFNSHIISKWTAKEMFCAARNEGFEGAVLADKKREAVLEKFNLKQNKISYPQLYALAMENVKFFQSGQYAPGAEEYASKAFETKVKTKRFEKDLSLFGKLTTILDNQTTAGKNDPSIFTPNRPYKLIKVLMDLHFNRETNEWFDLDVACKLIENKFKTNTPVFMSDNQSNLLREIKQMFGV